MAPDIPDNEHIFFLNGKTSACDSMLGEAFDTKDIKTLEMELTKLIDEPHERMSAVRK